MVSQAEILEEIKYVRGRVDEIYDVLMEQNRRITKAETKIEGHINAHWKWGSILVGAITAFIAIVKVVL